MGRHNRLVFFEHARRIAEVTYAKNPRDTLSIPSSGFQSGYAICKYIYASVFLNFDTDLFFFCTELNLIGEVHCLNCLPSRVFRKQNQWLKRKNGGLFKAFSKMLIQLYSHGEGWVLVKFAAERTDLGFTPAPSNNGSFFLFLD